MITLKEHVGFTRTGRPIVLPQHIVVRDGERVGYVGTQPNAPICFIVRLCESEVAEIVREVSRLKNGTPSRVSQPPDLPIVQEVVTDDPLA